MKELTILEIIGTRNAILHEFGIKVYKIAKSFLESNEPVCISFFGLKNVTSGFCNASVGKLYLEFPNAESLVHLKGLEGQRIWTVKVKDAIMLAKNPEKARIQNNAISELLAS